MIHHPNDYFKHHLPVGNVAIVGVDRVVGFTANVGFTVGVSDGVAVGDGGCGEFICTGAATVF